MAGVFETVYGATEEALKLAKKPLVKSRLKRRYSSAYEDAESKKLEIEAKIEELQKNVENYDINKMLEYRRTLTVIEQDQAALKADYKVMFGKELTISSVDED